MSVYTSLFIILCFSTCVSLYSLVLLILLYRVVLLVFLFEFVSESNGNCLGLSVRVKISTRHRKGIKATVRLEVVGCDIGYGDGYGDVDGVSVGGVKYVLVLVHQCTTNSFAYGMYGSSGADVCEVLWKFSIDAGGFPKTLQCDFDTQLIGVKSCRSTTVTWCTRIRAAPPHR